MVAIAAMSKRKGNPWCKPNVGRCVWCGKVGEMTEEHLDPRAVGGDEYGENVEKACRACNAKRGLVADFYAATREVYGHMSHFDTMHGAERVWVWQMVRRHNAKVPRAHVRWEMWREIEVRRLGRSESDCLEPKPIRLVGPLVDRDLATGAFPDVIFWEP